MPVENAIGAGLVVGCGYYISTHTVLAPPGAALVRVAAALVAIGILAAPFFR